MELMKLTDEMLEKNLTELVAKERSLLCVILLHVMEMARRKSYEKSHATLFEYLTDLLKYSHGSAQRRRDAALLALEVPEILPDVQSGALNLTQITAAQVGFRAAEKQNKKRVSLEAKREVLKAIRNKPVSKSEIIICSSLGIKPKAKIKTNHQADGSVRMELTFTKAQWQKIMRAKELLSHSVPSGREDEFITYMSERVIAHKDKTLPKKEKIPTGKRTELKAQIPNGKSIGRDAKVPVGKTTDITAEMTTDDSKSSDCSLRAEKIQTNDQKAFGQIGRMEKDIPLGKSNVSDEQISVGKSIKRDAKIPIGKPESYASTKTASARSAIPVAVQRAVFARDKCCQYQHLSTGKRCESQWQLQIDHIQPVWANGSDDLTNLRVLCAKHNRQMYGQQAGLH